MTYKRMEGETSTAYEAFCVYRNMGPDRSVAKAAGKLGKSEGTLNRWVKKWEWVSRAREYDDMIDEKKVEGQQNAVREMAERHTRIAQAFQGVAAAKMTEYKQRIDSGQPLDMSPSDVTKFADLGIKIERLIKGEPTERVEVPTIKIKLIDTNGDSNGE